MSRFVIPVLLAIGLAGCVSVSSSDPNPPQRNTVVTPGTTCSPAPCSTY